MPAANKKISEEWGVGPEVPLIVLIAAGLLFVAACIACIRLIARGRQDTPKEDHAGDAGNAGEEQEQERQDILAEVYGNADEAREEEEEEKQTAGDSDAALNLAWQAIQNEEDAEDEEQLIATLDHLHEEHFFPGSASSNGAAGTTYAFDAAPQSARDPAELAFGEAGPRLAARSSGATAGGAPVFSSGRPVQQGEDLLFA